MGVADFWRNPAAVVGGWVGATPVAAPLLRHRVRGDWWGALEESGATLLVSREYEHLLLALTVADGKPRITYMPLPHPSGIAFDERRGVVHVASTRNPNQLFELAPVTAVLERGDRTVAPPAGRPLLPRRSRFLPGATYVHDLAMVGGALHANAVGENAVIEVGEEIRRAWWPRCIEVEGEPAFDRNYIQLNSIAAGPDLASSFFSASSTEIASRRPGHRNYPVDRRGVIFSGATREPVAGGLTRPHSARLHGGELWVDDSGYGEVGRVADGRFETLARLPGWTRGLGLVGDTAFVATSRVIARFAAYAPGLRVEEARCGLHAVDLGSGEVRGSIFWPAGDQVFAIEPLPRAFSLGFPHAASGGQRAAVDDLFYAFAPNPEETT
ncbi:MAG TPA: DUF4915 domain-containing protein [Solirubrobacterales bacterium]|nr:DUF4915 domain-containing protein [Solirubrobacterales bacterium]